MNPILPGIGDIRIISKLIPTKTTSKNDALMMPTPVIDIGKCIELQAHAAVYEILDKNYSIVIPFELIEKYGHSSIDEAVKNLLNEYMMSIVASDEGKYLSNRISIADYYEKLKNLMLLSRQVLKEAEKAKKILSNI